MSTETNKQQTRAYFDHADRGDMASWRAAMAPDAVVQMNGDPEMSADQFQGDADSGVRIGGGVQIVSVGFTRR